MKREGGGVFFFHNVRLERKKVEIDLSSCHGLPYDSKNSFVIIVKTRENGMFCLLGKRNGITYKKGE